jgi:uncharacterized protein involved in cysteine biosynthesis
MFTPLLDAPLLLAPLLFAPLLLAVEQLDDPAILRVLLASVALSAACFAALCAGSAYGLHHALIHTGWLAWVAGLLGGAATLLAALWLFLPVAMVIASLFMESVCRAVERRFYPGLAPSRGAGLVSQLYDGVAVGARIGLLSLVSLLLALVLPGIGLLLGWAITAWALGRGLFVAVAMRRMGRQAAFQLYRRHRAAILLPGAALALAGTIPLVNLLVPILGTACMVHARIERRT